MSFHHARYQGCQILLGTTYQKRKNKYQITINYVWPQNTPNDRMYNRPNCYQIDQHLPLQDPPKFTQIWIFGLKIYHLATLLGRYVGIPYNLKQLTQMKMIVRLALFLTKRTQKICISIFI
jgi:hypothetical protein